MDNKPIVLVPLQLIKMKVAGAKPQSATLPLQCNANHNKIYQRCNISSSKPRLVNSKKSKFSSIGVSSSKTRVTTTAAASDAQSSASVTQETTNTGRKIVFAVDGTNDAEEGLRWLVKNICKKGDTVHLAHVICDPRTPATAVGSSTAATQWTPFRDEQVYAQEFFNRLEHEAQTMLSSRFIPSLQFTGVEYTVELLRLRVHKSAAGIGEALADCATNLNADVLVVASHGAGVLADYGSVARWVSENSPVPALLLPPAVLQQSAQGVPSNTIIVAATDDIKGLKSAFDFAVERMSKPGDNVYVIHAKQANNDDAAIAARKELVKHAVQWQEASKCTHMNTLNVAVDVITAQACEESSTLQAESTSFNGEQAPSKSPAGQELCSLASQLNAKAVILHHHGRSIMREMMYGPFTLNCLKNCERPLLVWDNLGMVRQTIDMD